MSNPKNEHWHDKNKNRARDGFNIGADKKMYKAHIDAANSQRPIPRPRDLERAKSIDGNELRKGENPKLIDQPSNENHKMPQALQPQLTPKGSMRETVNASVREKQEAIKAKLARDRELTR